MINEMFLLHFIAILFNCWLGRASDPSSQPGGGLPRWHGSELCEVRWQAWTLRICWKCWKFQIFMPWFVNMCHLSSPFITHPSRSAATPPPLVRHCDNLRLHCGKPLQWQVEMTEDPVVTDWFSEEQGRMDCPDGKVWALRWLEMDHEWSIDFYVDKSW